MTNLPAHCIPDSPLLQTISSLLGTCIPSNLYLFSNIFGCLSITAWLFAQLPQIFKNARSKSVDGLSPVFLANWLLGDICNLMGAVLTNQMWFQQTIGGYYVVVDLILCGQYWHYSRDGNGYEALKDVEVVEGVLPDDYRSGESDRSRPSSVEGKRSFRDAAKSVKSGSGSKRMAGAVAVLAGSKLAEAAPVLEKVQTEVKVAATAMVLDQQLVGNLSAWISASLYLSSRIPQLLKNYRRRSCQGLSIYLFVAAFFGNLFYSLSLLLNPLGLADYPPYGAGGIAGPDGSSKAEWWRDALPFFIGAAGVLSMDAMMFLQWIMWGEQDPLKEDEDFEEVVGERTRLLG